MEEPENWQIQLPLPLEICFGGNVCLGAGSYRSKDDGHVTKGALDIGWMDKPSIIGENLAHDIDQTPIVRLVFPKTESIDVMIHQLLMVKLEMMEKDTSCDAFESIEQKLKETIDSLKH